MRLFLILCMVLLATACSGDADGVATDTVPWGLDQIDIPDTEEAISSVFNSFPDQIDGRRGMGEWWGVSYGESDHRWHIQTQPLSDVQMPVVETTSDWLAWLASGKWGGVTLEAYSVDPTGDLMWVAARGPGPDLTGTEYILHWAKPDASWVFFAIADSEEGRRALVETFITAAGG